VLIQVAYPGDRFDFVPQYMLHDLIETKEIVRFKRTSGWVAIGVDPLRQSRRQSSHNQSKIVHVLYADNNYDYVTEHKLDDLIRSKQITKFKRKNEWVTIGVDPVRMAKRAY
jgi:hypothetical protein